MEKDYSITKYFGENLAELLSDKLIKVYKDFPKNRYITAIREKVVGLGYTQRIELHADEIRNYLPADYKKASSILLEILGPENPNETGMFSEFYWIMPLGKFTEKYGTDDFDTSMFAIEEITKRNTGEYAVRPFIRKYPEQSLKRIREWACSENFHLRRLASEGLRPKLPWATKLDTFIGNPAPVFEILEILKEDEVMFVKKSVANHLTDWLKVNREPAIELINTWRKSENRHTVWIIKKATKNGLLLKDDI
jgi:3-methyladenine DNA glycosylase AlkC